MARGEPRRDRLAVVATTRRTRDRLVPRGGQAATATVIQEFNDFDYGIGQAVSAVTEPYRGAGGEWFDQLRDSMREAAIDAAIKAMSADLTLWLANRADVELQGKQ
jgi:hypothetical protein